MPDKTGESKDYRLSELTKEALLELKYDLIAHKIITPKTDEKSGGDLEQRLHRQLDELEKKFGKASKGASGGSGAGGTKGSDK